jgi:hypothetical protein
LREVAARLARLESETGRFLRLCLEPEPGCVLQRSGDVERFWREHLLPRADEAAVRRHLGVCHDVCHAVVMFEEQEEVLRRYQAAGIAVGKVQVSSAVGLSVDDTPADRRAAAFEQLAGFAEDRYLHQTVVRPRGGEPTFFEDLPAALDALSPADATGELRVHFHVPIYLQRFGHLEALQRPILECLQYLARQGNCRHFEVETYAWGVLPPELRQPDLAAGIADELRWFREAWRQSDRR